MQARKARGRPEGVRPAETTRPEGPMEIEDQTAWPSTGSRPDTWTVRDPQASAGRRRRNTGAFHHAVAPEIAHATPRIDPELAQAADAATELMRAFDDGHDDWGVPFSSVLLRSESSSSSQIEHLTAGARSIALASIGGQQGRNATTIAANTEALRAAIRMADHISPNTIRLMHEQLGGGDDPDNAGRFRTEPVWIGGQSPVTAQFVAVHHTQIEPAIDDLVAFTHRDDIQPLVQATLAHAQFETIHPFTDGNGRTGRALVSAILRHRGVSRHMSVPISSGLLVDTNSYFDALTAYRQGLIEPIVEVFTESATLSVANATQLRADVAAVRDATLGVFERKTANITRLAAFVASEPAFTADTVIQQGIPTATAYRLLTRLQEAGIIRPEQSVRGTNTWSVPGLTSALDRFAQRAGRRSLHG